MFYFYALQSHKDNDLYCGYSDNVERRVQEHNKGQVYSTRNRRPLKLIYYEAYTSEKDARERERQIKKHAGAFTNLKRRLKNSILFR